MGSYSIKDLEQLSGIKAHTLRVWEQRYDIISPKRTNTNIRFYDDTDLRHVLNISFLNQNGHKISKIATLSPEHISHLVSKIADANLEFPNQVNALVISMVNLDEDRFEKIIATNTLQFGFERTMINIVYPFLQKIGILWQTGSINPAHEHFITNLIRQKLIVAIDGHLSPLNPNAKKYVLFLPEGELHELTLLFSAYIIKSRHNRAIYLGQSLPSADLATVNEVYHPDYLLTVISSSPTKNEVVRYVEDLTRQFPDSEVLISGYQAIKQKAKMPKGVTVFENIEELIAFADKNSVLPFSREPQASPLQGNTAASVSRRG